MNHSQGLGSIPHWNHVASKVEGIVLQQRGELLQKERRVLEETKYKDSIWEVSWYRVRDPFIPLIFYYLGPFA